jgi:glycosyltransferase involved in cell wall biosynthesis
MRLLYFTDNNSDHNHRFLEKLAVSGHEVFYLSLAGAPLPSFWLPRDIHLVESAQAFPRHTPPSELIAFLPYLQSILQEVKPDLVQAGAIQSCAYLTALAGFHPMLAMSWGSDLLVDSRRDHDWFTATKVALTGCDGFFCDCNTVLQRAREFAPIAPERVVQIPWGIHPGIFHPLGDKAQLPTSDSDFIFICTRSWEPIYGIDVLLNAFQLALQRSPHLRLLLIGHGSQESEVLSFIEDNDLGDRILIPGSLSSGDMPRYFRSANAYISCAESDGTSVSLLEAMATGLPVIVADNPSNREWVTEGSNGWLATIGSAESFASKMLIAVEQQEAARAQMGLINQRTVAERANWDENFPLLLSAYDNLLAISRTAK